MKYILLLLAFLFINYNSYACSCIGTATTKQAFKGANVVFTGKVIEKKGIRDWVFDTTYAYKQYQEMKNREPNNTETYDAFKLRSYTFPLYEYTFLVTKLYKGKSEEKLIKVRTGSGGGDCGYTFQLNQEYLVYGRFAVNNWFNRVIEPNQEPLIGIYETDICTNTTNLANAKKQLKELKRL